MSTAKDLRWWADQIATGPLPSTPWRDGLIKLLRQAAQELDDADGIADTCKNCGCQEIGR